MLRREKEMVSRIKENRMFKPLRWENEAYKKWYNRCSYIAIFFGTIAFGILLYGVITAHGEMTDTIITGLVLMIFYFIPWSYANGIRHAELLSRKNKSY